jgi:hypothetical protein
MFRLKTWIWTVNLLFVETFVLCILWNAVEPNPVYIQMLETFLPGFKWLSLKSALVGLAECIAYGTYLALNFVFIHNFFYRKHHQQINAPTSSKKAA